MTDRLKGVLVTFDRDIRDDDADPIIKAISLVRGVMQVKPYISGAEDYMMYHRGHRDARKGMLDFINKDARDPKID